MDIVMVLSENDLKCLTQRIKNGLNGIRKMVSSWTKKLMGLHSRVFEKRVNSLE
jgi:hypothetical protein